MRSMARPDHNWALIFFMAVIYLLILFPGIWLFSRLRGDFRITYALILGTVILFSWFYAEVGKRGYGESTGLRQMIVASPLGNQRVALRKCCSLFVTDGGPYAIPAHGDGATLALQSGGAFSGNAVIMNRPAGLNADIPPFSACSYEESSVLTTQGDYSIQVKGLELKPGLDQVEIVLGAGIPQTAQVYLVADDSVETLQRSREVWVKSGQRVPFATLFQVAHTYPGMPQFREIQEKNLQAHLVQAATSTQVGNDYGNQYNNNNGNNNAFGAKTPVGPVKILVYCDAPAELLPSQYSATGKVLFVSQFARPAVTPSTSPESE